MKGKRLVKKPECGEVIHRKTPLFDLKGAVMLYFRFYHKDRLPNLSTFLKKHRWTTPFYPHLRWIRGEKMLFG